MSRGIPMFHHFLGLDSDFFLVKFSFIGLSKSVQSPRLLVKSVTVNQTHPFFVG